MANPTNLVAQNELPASPVSADPAATTTHGIYLSGNFEIEEKISTMYSRQFTPATYTVSIVCGGIHRKKIEIYEIQARGFTVPQSELRCDHVYFLRGTFFPRNQLDTSSDLFFFEGQDHPFVATTKAYNGSMINCVGITGIGVIDSIETFLRSRVRRSSGSSCLEDNVTLVVTTIHSQFNPIAMKAVQAKVEYHIGAHASAYGVRPRLNVGQEYLFHGFVKDFNETTSCWVVVVNKVSATTGATEYIVDHEHLGLNANIQSSSDSGTDEAKPTILAGSDDSNLDDFGLSTKVLPSSSPGLPDFPIPAEDATQSFSSPSTSAALKKNKRPRPEFSTVN